MRFGSGDKNMILLLGFKLGSLIVYCLMRQKAVLGLFCLNMTMQYDT